MAALLSTLAAPPFQGLLARYRTLSEAHELSNLLLFARSEAIRRGVRVTICRSASSSSANPACDGGSWSQGWVAFLDNVDDVDNRPGVLDHGDLVLRTGEGRPSVFVDPGWIPNPAQDTDSDSSSGSTPKGSGDPMGVFGQGMPNTITLTGVRSTDGGSRLTLLFSDGRTAQAPAAGTGVRLRYRDGTNITRLGDVHLFLTADARATPTGPRRSIPPSGRYNWREFTPKWTSPPSTPLKASP